MGDGVIYRYGIDPLLRKPHTVAAAAIDGDESVLDVACGNGTLALMYAEKASSVLGIDIDPGSISYAQSRVEGESRGQVEFQLMDASDLGSFSDKQFDYSSASMAMHQFSRETAFSILDQMARVSRKILLVDYTYPMQKDFGGILVRLIEGLAGTEHHANFKSYMRHGGLDGLLRPLKLSPERILLDSKVFTVMEIHTL